MPTSGLAAQFMGIAVLVRTFVVPETATQEIAIRTMADCPSTENVDRSLQETRLAPRLSLEIAAVSTATVEALTTIVLVRTVIQGHAHLRVARQMTGKVALLGY